MGARSDLAYAISLLGRCRQQLQADGEEDAALLLKRSITLIRRARAAIGGAEDARAQDAREQSVPDPPPEDVEEEALPASLRKAKRAARRQRR